MGVYVDFAAGVYICIGIWGGLSKGDISSWVAPRVQPCCLTLHLAVWLVRLAMTAFLKVV